jgi:hypothetical protein
MGAKGNPVATETLADELRAIYRSDPLRSDVLMAAFLEQRLKAHDRAGQLLCLQSLVDHFGNSGGAGSPCARDMGGEEFSRLFSLLLGKRISAAELSSTELVEKLARSLNTVFDTLNHIIGVINGTLMGIPSGDETIRTIIGSNLEREPGDASLQGYLNRIEKAFLVAHEAFKQAVAGKLDEMLGELDPDRIASSSERGLKFGPLRRAELFDIYAEKFRACRAYQQSGRLLADLTREFEKNCQKAYGGDARRET